jgi:hypothetical protein
VHGRRSRLFSDKNTQSLDVGRPQIFSDEDGKKCHDMKLIYRMNTISSILVQTILLSNNPTFSIYCIILRIGCPDKLQDADYIV